MAFEINDLKGILILVLIAIPAVASTNINCSGRAFHCVNSTHFMICVDLGGGVSTTIDDFVIPCPATTECNENNIFECDFPEVTTNPHQVISVNKQSNISEPILVKNSVTTAIPIRDIFSVVKENITATTLPFAEDVTPVVKLEVFENIMTRVGVNNDNITETSVTSSLIDSKKYIFNDKRTSNNTVTPSTTDNNKHLEHAVKTSIQKAVNTSSTDKSTSIDTVTYVIGLINLMSTDPSSEVSTKPSSNVLTSLDSSNDNIATTTEQYNTNEVTIHGKIIENVTDKLNTPTDIIFNEKSVIADEVSTTLTLNTLIVNYINNKIENKTNSVNQTVTDQNSFGKSNNSNKIVPNTTAEYVPRIKIFNISKPITVDLSPQTTTDNTLVPLGQVDLISAEQKQSIPSTNDYIDTFLSDTTTTTTNYFITKQETTLSVNPVIVEIISTTPIAKTLVQNVLKSGKNNYSTGKVVTVEKVTETNMNSTFSGPTTAASMQTSTEKTFVPITTEATTVYTTETLATTEALINSDFSVEKQTTVTQPSEIFIAKDLPIVVNVTKETINTTKENSTVFTDSGTDIINHKVPEPVLILPPSMENSAIEMTTTETLLKGFTVPAIEVANESLAIIASSVNEPLKKNVKNVTLLNNTTDTMSPIEMVKTVFNALSSDIANARGTEPTTKKYPTIEISATEILQNEFTKHAIEAKNEIPATNGPINVNEHNLDNVEINAFLSVRTPNVPITTEATTVYTTETIATTEALINSDFSVEKQTTVTQPSEIFIAKDLPIVVNGKLTKNISVDTINTTKENSTVFTDSGTDIINHKVPEPVLLLPPSMENSAIEMTTTETLLKGFTVPAIEVANESLAIITSSVNEPLKKNVKNVTLLNNTTDTMSPIEMVKTVFNSFSSDIANARGTEPTTKKYPTIEISTTEILQNEFTKDAIEAKNEIPATNGPINVNEHNLDNVEINAFLSVHTPNVPYKVTSDPVKNTLVKDLTSQSDIATNPQTGFTPAIITHKISDDYTSINHATTQKAVTDLVNKIPESLNQPDNLEAKRLSETFNVDQWTISIPDVVSTTTPFPSDVTGNTSISEIVKSGNQDNTSATSFVNTEDVSLKIIETSTSPSNQNLTELSSTTPETVHTRPSMDSINIAKQASTNTPNIADIHSVPTTDNKIETSTMFSVDATLYTSNFENITDITATILTQQKLLNQKQYSTTAATKRVGEFVPSTKTTAGYVLYTKNIDLNTSNQTNLVNTENIISYVDLNRNSNQTEAINPINGKNSFNATFQESTEITKKDENIKIVSVLDIVNASGNAVPIEMLQPTSSNDYIKTSASQDSSLYLSATDNVPDNNSMYIEKSVSQKNPVVIMLSAESKAIDSILTASSTRNFPVSEIIKEKNQYVSTEVPIPSTVQLKHIKSTTTTAVDYVTEKTNGDFSTEKTLTQQNSAILLSSVPTPDTATSFKLTKVPVYEKVTTTEDSAFITSSTERTPEVMTDNNTKMSTESLRLTSKMMAPQTGKYKTETSLQSAHLTTESTQTTILTQTTPLDKTSQNTRPGIKTTVSPQYVMSTVNTNIPQLMPSLGIVGITATQMTTESTEAAVLTETTSLAAMNEMNQNVQPGITTTDYPQYLTSKVNNNSSQSMPSLPIVEAAAAQITTEFTHTTVIAQATPLAVSGKPNQELLLGIKTKDLPQYMTSTVNKNMPQSISSLSMIAALQIPAESTPTKLFAQTKPLAANTDTNVGVLSGIETTNFPHDGSSTVGNNILKSKPSLPLVEVTAAQITTEPTHKTKISETTPLAAPSNTDQDILAGIKTTDVSQYATTTVTYYNAQSVSDVTTETIVDSLTAPDSMAKTIKVVGYKESGTHFGETILSDVMLNTPRVDNVKTVKNIIDHESIVVGTTSKNDEQNTSITSAKSVDINKAEIINVTASNWMPAEVNLNNVKIKESSKEKDDLKSSVLKSGVDFKNKTLVLNSSIISQMQPKDGKSVDKIEYKLITVSIDYKQAESGAPTNVTQSKTIITDENKNAESNSSVNANIEIMYVKKDHVPVKTIHIFDRYSLNKTKANMSSSNYNLSLKNSTINDELEQHLISTNHTVTTEVQSHLNESDKQSNKTSYELTLNGTSVHNLNLTSTKLNASSENTTIITVPASVFSCLNLTRGKYSDKKDCRKFYTCIGNLQPVLGTCPNNTVFSEINKQCTRNLSHCVRNNQFRCLFEGRFSDFFKDNIYYICVKNRIHGFIRYKLQCQDSYHLNKESIKCEKNEEISTQSGSVSETINVETKPHTKSEKMVSSDDFECEKIGKFPYAKDCSKYYECTKVKNVYRRKIKKCASDEVYDKKKKKCVESDSGEC